MRISYWSSDVCSSDLVIGVVIAIEDELAVRIEQAPPPGAAVSQIVEEEAVARRAGDAVKRSRIGGLDRPAGHRAERQRRRGGKVEQAKGEIARRVARAVNRKHIIAGGGEEGHRIGAIERVAAHEKI